MEVADENIGDKNDENPLRNVPKLKFWRDTNTIQHSLRIVYLLERVVLRVMR